MVKYRRLFVVVATTFALGIVPLTAASAAGAATPSAQADQVTGLAAVGLVYTPDGGHTWCC